jgi:hypothetical protein
MKPISILRTFLSEPRVFSRLLRLSFMAFVMSVLYAQTIDYLTGVQFVMHSTSVGIFTILIFWITEQGQDAASITGISD